MDRSGKVLSRAAIPPLAAPLDLTPKTVTLKLDIPAGRSLSGARIHVALADGGPEVTQMNNEVTLP